MKAANKQCVRRPDCVQGWRKGDFVSVWCRSSRRHKWLCEFGMVRIIRVDAEGVLVQTSQTGAQYRTDDGVVMQHGPTSMALTNIYGTLQRELRPALWHGKQQRIGYRKITARHPMFKMVQARKAQGQWVCDAWDHNEGHGCSNPDCFKYEGKKHDRV